MIKTMLVLLLIAGIVIAAHAGPALAGDRGDMRADAAQS
jgi:hypothetical protein